MKKCLCLLLSLLIMIFCCACDSATEDDDRLTYYYTDEYRDDMVEIINRYNRWCGSHSTEDMKISLVRFDSYDTMSQRLNVEVMSGGGPDLFSNFMDLPFEQLMQNDAFYDLNDLIENDTAKDKINIGDYNRTIMDAGVVNGKRYYVPAFYNIHTLVGEKEVFEKYHMPTQQGYHLTFDNMDEVFSEYLKDPDTYGFMDSDNRIGGVNADTLILRLVNSQMDYENKTVLFDGDFKEQLELLTMLRERSVLPGEEDSEDPGEEEAKPYLFRPSDAYSNPIMMEQMLTLQSFEDYPDEIREWIDNRQKLSEPVLYAYFEKDENTYSANIVDALFVNAKTKKADKALAFIKFLLSDHIQNLYAGTDEEYWSGGKGLDCLPVLNTALEYCVRDAYKITDIYGGNRGVKEELTPATQALIRYIEKINSVNLYFDLYHSNYDKNVAIPILQEYWDGKIDVNKCADNLYSATKIYILE